MLTVKTGGHASGANQKGETIREDIAFTQAYRVSNGRWYQFPDPPQVVTAGASLVNDGSDVLLLGGANNTSIYKFTGTGWRLLLRPYLQNPDRAYSSILTVPDSALKNCRKVKK